MTTNSKRMTPVDEDLQRLYNEVWAGFEAEVQQGTSNSTEKEIENIYNVYGRERGGSTSTANAPVQSSSSSTSSFNRLYAGPVQGHLPTSSTPGTLPSASPVSPSSPRRRLPPTPGGSTSSTATFQMPEPQVYQDPSQPARPSPYTFDGHGGTYSNPNDLLKQAVTTSGRRLPQTPTSPQSNGYQEAGRSSPTPSSRLSYSPQSPSFDKYSKPLPDPYNGNQRSSMVKVPYELPPGASAPTIPEYVVNDYQASFNAYESDGPRNDRTHGNTDMLSAPSQPQSISHQASYETLGASRYNASASLPQLNTGYDHSYSAGPSSSSQRSVYETPTTSTFPPASAYYDNQPSSSSSTNLPGSSGEQWPAEQDLHRHEQDPNSLYRRPTDVLRTMADFEERHQENHVQPADFHDHVVDDYWDEEEEDPSMFINLSLLSHIAVQLRDKIPRATHVKGGIPYDRAFTGKDVVSTIQGMIQRELAINHGLSTSDRRVAVQVARSLQSQLFFYEVEWGGAVLQDGVEDVYMFLDDQEGGSSVRELEELPTGVITMLTRCYSPSCGDGVSCYAFGCPRKGNFTLEAVASPVDAEPMGSKAKRESWSASIDPVVLSSLPESEVKRQSIIHGLVVREEQYVQDLDIVETVFLRPLRRSGATIMPQVELEDFIDEVFGNILDLRECNRRLLEVLYVRQREQAPIIQKIGDIFLEAATEFRLAYPTYIGHYPVSEKRLKDELEKNHEFRLFVERCSRESSRPGDTVRFDLKHFLGRPSEHLQKYPVLLDAILNETSPENPDADFLKEAITAISSLQSISQLRTFQSAMCKGPPGKWEWHDLVSEGYRKSLPKKEAKRQSIIFELIKGEMAYVKDLENIEVLFIRPLRTANPPIISRERLDQFIADVFHNYDELLQHHRKLVEAFQEIQREQHPVIRSITDAMMDAALNFREAYMEYIPNYPIAAYRIDDEMANNPAFKAFVEQCVRHPDSHRLDMKSFVNRPIPRLLRYELLLKGIMEETEPGHEDHDMIPNVIDVIKALGKETEPGVFSAKQKVELWRYNSNIVFNKQGEFVDMDLLDPNRILIHSGKLLRQPDSGLEWNWSELFVLLFDNYLVMTKIKESKEKDGVVKYIVNRRPIPLDLLTLVNYTDAPTQRGTGLLRNLRNDSGLPIPTLTPDSASDARAVYPLTLHHNGRMGGAYILYAESAQIRTEWKEKLEEAIGLRKAVQESNKVFEVETLSSETFLVPLMASANQGPTWEQNNAFTGRVTCSVPFTTPDRRRLVAVGCQEGVWIGYRHDPNSLRRVLHLKAVTQCAMLEEFGIFLVLADKSLFAYHIEALVPSSPHTPHSSQVPQKLNGTKDVHFFSVGTLHGRTLVAYMKKKGLDSIFRVLEPVGDKINEKVKAPVGLGSRLGFRSTKSEWFRIYRDFFLPSESFDLIFLKARIAILCAKGFEIMDLNNFNSVTIPHTEDPKFSYLSKRCDGCRPMGMFRSLEDEFLLCYDEFGVYVDKHGDPSRGGVTIEWEGTAERVAFHPPHILLFDSRFIEVRNIETGRLAQIIPGNDIRCIWDGRGVSTRVTDKVPVVDPGEPQEAKVHAVMTNLVTAEGAGRTKAIAQQVFELVPTVALYPSQETPKRQQQFQQQQDQYLYHQQELYHAQQRQQQQRQQYAFSDNASMYTSGTGYGVPQQQHYNGGYAPRTSEGYAMPGPSEVRPSPTSSWRS
ncbi:signal transducer [Coprinopsis cinerea okayama7|uniref:Signal transducer n=1 Tax=Coprinopsis cinerea (strain Okayama-7 / 130 / ATCC MYA-4618 / FGSC 9003) TaxID=240176 RepID=A8N8T8_COPC7|nr:signal transducer [Coprinopsis cinerea okayama7\|eukprot:XP_001831266.2 signal transducer [Coprinopsis cinerea okayama7\